MYVQWHVPDLLRRKIMLEHFENKHLSKLVVKTLGKLFYTVLTPLTIPYASETIHFSYL